MSIDNVHAVVTELDFLNRLVSKGGCIVSAEVLSPSEITDATNEGDVFIAANGLMFVRVNAPPRDASQDYDSVFNLEYESEIPTTPVLKALMLIDDECEEFRTDFLVR